MNLNKSEVLKQVMRLSLHWESEGVVNVSLIAVRMNSTNYYVLKRIKTLIKEGYLKKAVRNGGWCPFNYEPYPPMKGYILTEKAKRTELYTKVKIEEEKALTQAFEC